MKVYRVELKRYKKGYCPTVCKTIEVAEKELENLELQTGLKWKITEIEK